MRCFYCRAPLTRKTGEVDHVARLDTGKLQLLCHPCNEDKSWVQADVHARRHEAWVAQLRRAEAGISALRAPYR